MNSIYEIMEKSLKPSLKDIELAAKARGFQIGEEDDLDSKTITVETLRSQIEEVQEYYLSAMTNQNKQGASVSVPTPDFNETLTTADASIALPRIISQMLQEPNDPQLFLQNSLAETVELGENAPLFVEFPQMATMKAYELSEGQAYTNEMLSWTENRMAIQMRKYGVMASLTDEIIKRSLWPLVAMTLRHMGLAINRLLETKLYSAMTTHAREVFDNEDTDSVKLTTGKAQNQNANGTFSFHDLVKMYSVVIGHKYNPSHLLMHPLAWPVFAQDPVMREQWYHGGQLGAGSWSKAPNFDQQSNTPFGLQYVPYYAIRYVENSTLTQTMSGYGASLVTDIYMLDKANSLFMLTRGGTTQDQREEWFTDSMTMKARRYAGPGVKDLGRGMCVAKNIRVVRNYEASATVNMVSV